MFFLFIENGCTDFVICFLDIRGEKVEEQRTSIRQTTKRVP